MKYEIKIDYKNTKLLKQVIENSYFQDGNKGKLIGKRSKIIIESEDPLNIVFKGLNNLTVKLTNDEMIDGSMRCIIEESENGLFLYPINNYCIISDEKYTFY